MWLIFLFTVIHTQTKRRMLGNIQFIGELYKKAMLKENVMKTCVEHLLNATKEVNPDRQLKGLKFINGEVDVDNLEVRYDTTPTEYDRCDLVRVQCDAMDALSFALFFFPFFFWGARMFLLCFVLFCVVVLVL